MPPSLDIFKIDPGGRVLWRGAVESFVAAKARIQKLALSSLSSPGEYLILDQDTGQRVLIMLLGGSPQTTPVAKQVATRDGIPKPLFPSANTQRLST
jgi:hypothetical protein